MTSSPAPSPSALDTWLGSIAILASIMVVIGVLFGFGWPPGVGAATAVWIGVIDLNA